MSATPKTSSARLLHRLLETTLDDDGRFRIEGLIPGVAYDLGARNGNTLFGYFTTALSSSPARPATWAT